MSVLLFRIEQEGPQCRSKAKVEAANLGITHLGPVPAMSDEVLAEEFEVHISSLNEIFTRRIEHTFVAGARIDLSRGSNE
jgi:hypothetical protein